MNKRFYKLTEEEVYDQETEIKSDDDDKSLTLIAFEGTMLPSKTELQLAKKASFYLYTTTNLSFADLAQHLGV